MIVSMHRMLPGLVALLLLVLSNLATGQSDAPARWLEVESLNAGLGEPPADLDRGTPRQTVSQLLVLADRAEFDRAAHLLDLGELPGSQQAERGPDLARKLVTVINRTMVIDWNELPTRPDALLESAPKESPLAGQPRRSIGLRMLELDRRPAEIRISRLKPTDGEAVWVFASQTVRDIDALYERYGPGWLEERLPDALQGPAILGTRVWEWLVLPLTVALLVVLGWLTRGMVGTIGRWLPIDWVNRAARRVRTPIAVALMAILCQVLTGWVISFSGFFYKLLTPLLVGLTIIALTLAALRSIDATLERVTERFVDDIDDANDSDRRELYTSIYALRRFVLLAAVLIGGTLFIGQTRLFDSIGLSLLASAGVLTVILGIAGRTVLGNILASLQIAVAKPVRIGDAVKYEDQWGFVEAIYYTFLVLRTWDGRRQIVPVQYFISYPFENWSMIDASITHTITLKLDHAAEPGKLRKAFEKLVKKDDRAIQDELLLTAVTDHNEDFQEITLFATAANPTDAWRMQLDLREGMAEWVRRYHPEWWPRERLYLNGKSGQASRSKANANSRKKDDDD